MQRCCLFCFFALFSPPLYTTEFYTKKKKRRKLKTKPKSCCDECRGARKKNGERCIVSTSLNITLTTMARESRLTSASVKCFEFRRVFCSTFHAPAHGQRLTSVSLFISSRVHHTQKHTNSKDNRSSSSSRTFQVGDDIPQAYIIGFLDLELSPGSYGSLLE